MISKIKTTKTKNVYNMVIEKYSFENIKPINYILKNQYCKLNIGICSFEKTTIKPFITHILKGKMSPQSDKIKHNTYKG